MPTNFIQKASVFITSFSIDTFITFVKYTDYYKYGYKSLCFFLEVPKKGCNFDGFWTCTETEEDFH